MQSYLDRLEAKALAEAEALQWVRDNLGFDPEPSTMRRERDICICAAARGIVAEPFARYPRLRATRQWVQYLDSLKLGTPARPYRRYLETRADRLRQAQRREHKRGLLAALPTDGSVSIAEACALTDSGRRTIEKALTSQELVRERRGRDVRITLPSLRDYLAARVASPA